MTVTNAAGHTYPQTVNHVYRDYDHYYLDYNTSIANKHWGELFPRMYYLPLVAINTVSSNVYD
jgi:hypothetical protein